MNAQYQQSFAASDSPMNGERLCPELCPPTSVTELGPNGPDTHGAVSSAVDALMTKPTRGQDGRFVPGSPAAVTSGENSEQLSTLLEPARRAIVQRTMADVALDETNSAETMRRLVEAHAEVSLLRESVFMQIGRLSGPVTGKGKMRALLSAYLSLVDRETRLAQAIGLERRSKAVPNLRDIINGQR